jgi:RNA polymerase sigma-70 factor (ECF subfamily)
MKGSSAGSAEYRGQVHTYFERCSPAVLRLALRITRNEADAEEVRQEVFLKLQEYLPRLDRTGNLAGWIFRTATTVSLKARDRRLRLVPDLGECVGHPSAPGVPDGLEADLARVSRALERLPESPRRLLLERFRDGRSPAEIARRLGLAAGSVRVQLFRAMEILREALRSMP